MGFDKEMSDWAYIAGMDFDKEASDGPFIAVLTRGRPSIKAPPGLMVYIGSSFSELSSDDPNHDIDLENREEFPPPQVARSTPLKNRQSF